MSDTPTRAGFCAIVGAPNAGKSTLVNALVGTKIAIVTPKPQTTRAPVRGVAMMGAAQVVLVDTPGIFVPRRRLDRAMVDAAWTQAGEADVVVLLIDAARLGAVTKSRPYTEDEEVARVLAGLANVRVPLLLALNKIDKIPRDKLLQMAQQLGAALRFQDVFMISALNGDGVADLGAALAGRMPEGPWLYPPDQAADMPSRLLAAEITREKLMLKLHDELPYASAVETERWEERKDGSVRIDQIVYVERDSQKAIVLGKGGRTIKAIGADSRAELETVLERRVHLFLFVKVREGWGDEPDRYRDIGLDFRRGSARNAMEWQDEAIVLLRRGLGESSVVAELFTRAHGRHLGLVRGSRSLSGILQPGNLVGAVWRARLSDHLGTYKIEPVRARMGALLDEPEALAALRAICALAAATLPEREPHPALFEATSILIDHLTAPGGASTWPALLVRWELGLLNELGFGLDLTACAVTGVREDLLYVSPRTGRAVSRKAGAELADRLLRLPAFLLGSQAATPDRGDIRDGLRLTGHFIETHLLAPHGKALPAARFALSERFKG